MSDGVGVGVGVRRTWYCRLAGLVRRSHILSLRKPEAMYGITWQRRQAQVHYKLLNYCPLRHHPSDEVSALRIEMRLPVR